MKICTAGKKFTSMLLKESLGKDFEIKTLKVYRQWNKIDICAEINGNEIFLAIEDKTNTKEHGKQLDIYKDSVKNEKKNFNYYSFIYFKNWL